MRPREGNKEKDIIIAAIQIIAEVGFHNAKISRIAETAGVATGSVYSYFKSKDDLLINIFKSLWENLYIQMKNISSNDTLSPVEKIDGMLDLIFDIFTENRNLALVFVNEQSNLMRIARKEQISYYDKFLAEGMNAINEGISKGIFNKNLDVNIFRQFILGALRNLLYSWAVSPKDFPLSKLRLNAKQITKYGIQKI